MDKIDLSQSLQAIVKQIIKSFTSSFKTYDNCYYIELYPIIQTSNINKLLIAKTILQDTKINFYVKNEYLQNLFTVGQICTGYNLLVGPMIIEVYKKQCDEALDLLKPLFDQE